MPRRPLPVIVAAIAAAAAAAEPAGQVSPVGDGPAGASPRAAPTPADSARQAARARPGSAARTRHAAPAVGAGAAAPPSGSGTGSGTGSAGRDARPQVSVGGDGLTIEAADGRLSLDVGGRLHVDWTRHADDAGGAAPVDGTDLRRARIAAGARLDDAWRFSGEVDFAGDDVSVTDLWLGYDVSDALRVTIGQQKQPYSLG